MPEAPLGEPRDDEPRLVAARGFPRDAGRDPRVRRRPASGDRRARARRSRPASTTPPKRPRCARPCRCARRPTAPPTPTPRRAAPAPPKPRRRRARPKTPKGPRTGGGAHWGRRIFTLIAGPALRRGALRRSTRRSSRSTATAAASVAVDIPQNTDAAEIAKLLAAKGVVDSARFFELKATISGERGKLRPGHYTLKKGMTNGAAIDALTKVPEAPKAAPRRST